LHRAYLTLEQNSVGVLHSLFLLIVAVRLPTRRAAASAAADEINKPTWDGRGQVMPVLMVREEFHDGVSIPLTQNRYAKAKKRVNDVRLVHVLQYSKVSLQRFRRHEAEPRSYGVYGAHPQYGENLALHKRLVKST
jgi:hypothetical protein